MALYTPIHSERTNEWGNVYILNVRIKLNMVCIAIYLFLMDFCRSGETTTNNEKEEVHQQQHSTYIHTYTQEN